MSLPDLWHASLAVHNFSAVPMPPRVDNPFLVHYVAYHHFRSLGWVVRSGIKFCADMLLYKRGPVFTHAEFVQTYNSVRSTNLVQGLRSLYVRFTKTTRIATPRLFTSTTKTPYSGKC